MGSSLFYYLKNKIGPSPTSGLVAKYVISILPKKVDGVIYDLGAGFGTMALKLANNYPGNKVVVIENNWLPFIVSKLIFKFLAPKNLVSVRADIYSHSLKDAGLIYCYLCPYAMRKLSTLIPQKINRELLLVSSTFAVPGWKPQKVSRVNDLYQSPIYTYLIDSTK